MNSQHQNVSAIQAKMILSTEHIKSKLHEQNITDREKKFSGTPLQINL